MGHRPSLVFNLSMISWSMLDPIKACGSLIELFSKMEWDDQCRSWDEEADLRDVIRYARGSRRLQIPLGWKDVLPKTIPP